MHYEYEIIEVFSKLCNKKLYNVVLVEYVEDETIRMSTGFDWTDSKSEAEENGVFAVEHAEKNHAMHCYLTRKGTSYNVRIEGCDVSIYSSHNGEKFKWQYTFHYGGVARGSPVLRNTPEEAEADALQYIKLLHKEDQS